MHNNGFPTGPQQGFGGAFPDRSNGNFSTAPPNSFSPAPPNGNFSTAPSSYSSSGGAYGGAMGSSDHLGGQDKFQKVREQKNKQKKMKFIAAGVGTFLLILLIIVWKLNYGSDAAVEIDLSEPVRRARPTRGNQRDEFARAERGRQKGQEAHANSKGGRHKSLAERRAEGAQKTADERDARRKEYNQRDARTKQQERLAQRVAQQKEAQQRSNPAQRQQDTPQRGATREDAQETQRREVQGQPEAQVRENIINPVDKAAVVGVEGMPNLQWTVLDGQFITRTGDIGGLVTNLEECRAACAASPECQGITIFKLNGYCNMKSHQSTEAHNDWYTELKTEHVVANDWVVVPDSYISGGGDVHEKTFWDLPSCRQACMDTPDCMAITQNENSNECYLKMKVDIHPHVHWHTEVLSQHKALIKA